jgi:Plavaka transposase
MFTGFAAAFLLIHHFQPFTSDFPRGDIYEMISPDILHQLIKGAFKDHLVAWVGLYLLKEHGERKAGVILDNIDRRQVIS